MFIKSLIALACVAVISGVGYYFWTEYARGQEERRVAEWRQQRELCLDFVKRRLQGNAELQYLSEDCIKRGMVREADIKAMR